MNPSYSLHAKLTAICTYLLWLPLWLCGAEITSVQAAPQERAPTNDSSWVSLLRNVEVQKHAVTGSWRKSGTSLSVNAMQGARLTLPVQPAKEYEIRMEFTRTTGKDSIGFVLVQNGKQVVLEVDAWGEHLAGLQDIRGQTIRENATRKEGFALQNGQKYSLSVQVHSNSIKAKLDNRVVCDFKTNGEDLSIHSLWRLPDANSLGIVAWDSETTFHSIEYREMVSPSSSNIANRGEMTTASGSKPSTNRLKTVLIVIANEHFFYREYAEPRAELERAGYTVKVAAGAKSACTPHPNTGQGNNSGVVVPDLALREVNAKDYEAILFSGGWGASSYQFAFPGRYDYPSYNGSRDIKVEANRVISDFVKQDKYVCALCNGVSVLAWARVDGKSPLDGKRVCAPVREAPAGMFDGRAGQPSCRWHPEKNGARLSPPGAIGRPGDVSDDVLVDGKIITGEDDPSAREMGRRIAIVLADGS